jgi:hypothetical protein
MIVENNIEEHENKSLPEIADDIGSKLLNTQITQHFASGTVDNDKLPLCRIYASNGFPHESLRFEKVNGRIRSDDTNEVQRWVLKDYFTTHNHVHQSEKAAGKEERLKDLNRRAV